MATTIYPAAQGPYDWTDDVARGRDHVGGNFVSLLDPDAAINETRHVTVEVINAPMIQASEWVYVWQGTGPLGVPPTTNPITVKFTYGLRSVPPIARTYGHQFLIGYKREFLTSGRMPPVLRARISVRETAGGAVVATREQEWRMYRGDQRALPFALNYNNAAFAVETPVVAVTQGSQAQVVFRDRTPSDGGDAPDRQGVIEIVAVGAESWAIGALDDGTPSTDPMLSKPFIRLDKIEVGFGVTRLVDAREETTSTRGELSSGQSFQLDRFYKNNLLRYWRVTFDILVNAAWPQYLELRFYRRVKGDFAQSEAGEFWQDFYLTTRHEPTLDVPDTVTLFDAGTAIIPVAYRIPPDADATVTMTATTLTGDAIDTAVLSVAPGTLDFTPANARTTQDLALGLAAGGSAMIGEPVRINYVDDAGVTASTDVETRADEGEATSAADSDLVVSVSPRSVTLEHGGSASLQVGTTAVTKADTTIRLTTDDASLSIVPSSVTIPAAGGTAQVQLRDTATDQMDRSAMITIELVSSSGVVLDTTTVTVAVRSTSANLPDAAPGHRYQINGVLQSADDAEAVSFEMDMAWAGESVFRDGAWRYLPGTIRPSVLTITPDMVIDVERCQIGPDSQDRINSATMQIAQDTGREYLPRRLAKITLEDALTLDGHEREIDMGSRAFINNRWQAIRTLAVMMRRTRYEALYILRIRPGPNLERYHVHPGDVVTYTDARYNVYGSRCRVIASTINPDLSMTLSLRQESPGVYQDVPAESLPEIVDEIGKTGLWTRLFEIPNSTIANTQDMAAVGRTIAIQPPGTDPLVVFNDEGTVTGSIPGPGTIDNRAFTAWAGIAYLNGTFASITRHGIRNILRIGMEVSDSLSGQPPTAIAPLGDEVLAMWRSGRRAITVRYFFDDEGRGITRTLAGRNMPDAQPPVGLAVIPGTGEMLTSTGGIQFYKTNPNTETTVTSAFTFQGQGDENNVSDARIECMAITTVDEQERLYVVVNQVEVEGSEHQRFLYCRRNATEPDE